MISFLKLIRLPNLLIIAFTQCLVRWCLVAPLLKAQSTFYTLQLSNFNFFLLVLSTVMIAAGGYIINDYFDIKIDKVNKPDRLVIDKGVKRRVAMMAHTVISIFAMAIALYVSWSIGHWKLALIHFICASGLWFYSTTFKRQFIVGNIVIAAFTAIVPLVVGIFELLPVYHTYLPVEENLSFLIIWKWVLGISFFAFIITLLREILKDIEDKEGDQEFGCNTMPIVIGIKPSKAVAIIIAFATMCCLGYLQLLQYQLKDWVGLIYFTIAIQLPFAFLIFKIIKAQTKDQFHFAGNTAKFIMLTGVCYLIVFNYFLFQ